VHARVVTAWPDLGLCGRSHCQRRASRTCNCSHGPGGESGRLHGGCRVTLQAGSVTTQGGSTSTGLFGMQPHPES